MRGPARTPQVYLVLAMLTAAMTGRFLDAAALLPGVAEAAPLRSGSSAWVASLVAAAVVGVAAAARWSRTSNLRAVAVIVVPGQMAVFFLAEAFVRVANGQGAVDPDGAVGALLQAGLAVLLLLALTLAWIVALKCRVPRPQAPPARRHLVRPHHAPFPDTDGTLSSLARGPPRLLST